MYIKNVFTVVPATFSCTITIHDNLSRHQLFLCANLALNCMQFVTLLRWSKFKASQNVQVTHSQKVELETSGIILSGTISDISSRTKD